MPVGWCESIPFDRMRKWKRKLFEAIPYLLPVFFSIILTQVIWVGVYQCRDKYNIIKIVRCKAGDQSSFCDSINNNSIKFDYDFEEDPKTPEEFIIESLQIVAIVAVIYVISFVIDSFATKNKKMQEFFYPFLTLYLTFFCTFIIVLDATDRLDLEKEKKENLAVVCILAYFYGAIFALSSEKVPVLISQYYRVMDCVLLSVVYLTFLPGNSFWTITATLFFFHYLTRCISARLGRVPDPVETKDMSAVVRRFVIYEVKVPQKPDGCALDQIEVAQSNKCLEEVGEICYIEFAIYGILVGQSLTWGIIPGIFSACGVLIGVVWSVKSRKNLVHLPNYSVLFGFCGHFGALIVQYAVIFLLKTTDTERPLKTIIDRLK